MTNRTNRTFIFVLIAAIVFAFFSVPQQTAHAAVLYHQPNNLGLVAYYPFNEGVGIIPHDFSGNGNDGTFVGAPAWTSGKRGNALSFGGTTDVITAPAVLSGNSAFTAVAWVKPGDTTTAWKSIFGTTCTGFDIAINASIFQFGRNCGGVNGVFYGGPTVVANQWYHVAAVFNGTNIDLYVNNQKTTGGAVTYTHSTLRIGGSFSSATELFKGVIDDVRIYNRPLGATEISYLYNSGSVVRKNISNQSLVGYWPMNEGRGSKALDFSGTNNAATLQNGVSWTSGKRSSAVLLNGNNSYVEAPSTSNLKYTGGNMTLSAWIKPDSTESDGGDILSKPWNGGGQYNYRLTYNAGRTITFSVYGTSSGDGFTSTGTASLNAWHHILATVDSSRLMKIYIDGAFSGSYTHSITTWSPSSGDANLPLAIGTLYPYGNGWVGNTAFSFKGAIDDVREYNRVFTAAEISTLYGLNETKINAPQNTKMTNGLVGYWTFNGQDMTTSTSTDVSGSGKDGTLISGPKTAIGKVGQALSFNGTNSYVSIPSISVTEPYTISFWAYPNDISTLQILFSTACSGGQVYLSGGSWVTDHCGSATTVTSTPASLNAWQHVTAVFESSNSRKIYINGQLKVTSTVNDASTSATYTAFGRRTSDGYYYNGKLDEVRIYNRALSASEVNTLYSLGK